MPFSKMGPHIVYPDDIIFAGMVENSLVARFKYWMKYVNAGLFSYSTVIVSITFYNFWYTKKFLI